MLAAGCRTLPRRLLGGWAAGPVARRWAPAAVICRPAVAEPAESTQGAALSPSAAAAAAHHLRRWAPAAVICRPAVAAGGCCCFVAEAGRVAGRGAEAAGC